MIVSLLLTKRNIFKDICLLDDIYNDINININNSNDNNNNDIIVIIT